MMQQVMPNPTDVLLRRSPAAIHAAFLRKAADSPEAMALSSRYGTCSYAELERISRQLALALQARGLKPGDRVAILSDRNPALVYAMLGVLRAAAAFTIADSAYPAARIAATLEQVRPAILLACGEVEVPPELQRALQEAGCLRLLRIPAAAAQACAAFAQFGEQALETAVDLEQTAYVSFTSGSTGRPKGIATSHAPLPHFVDWHASHHGFDAHDRFSALSGLGHDPFLRDVFTPLSIGAALCIPQQATIFDPVELIEWLQAQAITVCHLTPALGEIIATGAEIQAQTLPALRHLFWGGDVLSPKTSRRLRAAAPKATQVNFYGATETPQAMAYFTIDPDWRDDAFPIGRGIADTQLLLVTESGKLAQAGELGEIWIRSPYLSQGYLHDAEQTHARFVAHPFSGLREDLCYRTGDLGRYLPEGNVAFAGRMDQQVKIRGFRVEPGEVARTMERFGGVTRALVLARDAGEGKALAAYFTCTDERADLKPALFEFLGKNLPAYMVPASLVRLERFPLLPNGKIDLQSLPAPAQADAPAAGEHVAPRDAGEAELAQVWQDILGIDRVGVNDNFLALGGDSLSALRALVRMKKLGIPAGVARGIFQGRTIREIVEEANGARHEPRGLAPEQRTNLLINILRGTLLLLVVADHWIDGLLIRLAGKEHSGMLVEAVAPLLNLATPGFAFVFGVGLGYVYYAKHRASPAQARRDMALGAVLLLAGICAGVAMNLAALRWEAIDSTLFFGAFFSALLYYALALLTAPLWFRLIAAARREYLACAALMAASYLIFRGCEWLLLEREQTGFLQLVRLMLVAKYSYFNMSVGALGGVMAGIYMKRHCAEDLSRRAFACGAAGVLLGAGLLYLGSGSMRPLYDHTNMGLWRWAFDIGLVLILAGAVAAVLRHHARLPASARSGLQLSSILGQGTFPLFVLHGLVLPAKTLLLLAGLSASMALTLPFALFFALSGWMLMRLYQLYYAQART